MNKNYDYKQEMKKDWYLFLLILVMFLSGIALYSRLPDQIPIHWNIEGEVDDYASRFWGVFMLPFTNLLVLLTFTFMPLLDPRKENYPKFSRSYRAIKAITVVFFAVLHFLVLAFALGYELDISRIVVVGAALLFIVMGNYLPKVKHNYFVGVRVPWTLASEKVWKKTHRFAGKLFVISGIIIFLSIFVSEIIRFWLIMICALVTSLASMVYSYLVYRQEEG
ncbi:MAG TPA: SdpI family protein [Halanaerobiaceae bacterium]|jgi:uncharacterized membrane protein|nr:SdpI family protein [Bacillota bacterium]HHU92187.1 SdpI family protein [Halanaerobiaceae bacterium]HOA41533.1 SdpI family protein [Halanaerobiales bacterium]HPZ63580.1 SdpI family protein [Halanaerobiales bacterium]HQD04894.1 SdpI family protein [Halanaerobiales bacterium]